MTKRKTSRSNKEVLSIRVYPAVKTKAKQQIEQLNEKHELELLKKKYNEKE